MVKVSNLLEFSYWMILFRARERVIGQEFMSFIVIVEKQGVAIEKSCFHCKGQKITGTLTLLLGTQGLLPNLAPTSYFACYME